MKITEKKLQYVETTLSISCDCCKEVFIIVDEETKNIAKNFVSVDYTSGYGSKYDGDNFTADFCEPCAFKILGKYWKKNSENNIKI